MLCLPLMLMYISNGLVNGARGVVVYVVTNNDHDVTTVLVSFSNDRVGIQSSPYRLRFPHAVYTFAQI